MPALSAPSAMGSLGLLFLVLAVLSQPARAGPVWRVITVNNNLTVPRLAMASITNGVWSFFAGGWYSAGVRSECELIDLRNGFSSACTNALDVFDPLTSIMLSTALPALQKTAMMVVGLGSKIYMGGGESCNSPTDDVYVYDTVTVYDIADGTSSSLKLSTPRRRSGSIAVQDIIIFAGGNNGSATIRSVDVYNTTTQSWMPITSMSTDRAEFNMFTFQNEVWVLGGFGIALDNPDAIETYSLLTHSWTVQSFTHPQPGAGTPFALVKDVIVTHGGFDGTTGNYTNPYVYNRTTDVWTVATMQAPRVGAKAAVYGNKVFFIGSYNTLANTSIAPIIDIYDADLQQWSTVDAPNQPGACVVILNDIAYVMGGSDVLGNALNVCEVNFVCTNTLQTGFTFNLVTLALAPIPANLTDFRSPYCAAVQSKAVYVGGYIDSGVSNAVDMYSSASQTWRTFFLSQRRTAIAAATVGKKVFFAGGFYQSGSSSGNAFVVVPTVDIYDMSTNTWSKHALTTARTHIGGGATGEIAIFAGGFVLSRYGPVPQNVIDMHNATSNVWWSVAQSIPRVRMGVASLPDYVVFAGGDTGAKASKQVDIYHRLNNSWTSGPFLSVGRCSIAACAVGGRYAIFAGGANVTIPHLLLTRNNVTTLGVVDIWDSLTNTWFITASPLSPSRYDSTVAPLGQDSFVISGGELDLADTLTASVMMYNLTTSQWTQLPDLVQARSSLSSAAVSSTGIIALGGYAGFGVTENPFGVYGVSATGDYIGTMPSGGCPVGQYGDDCTCSYPQKFQIGMICLYGTWFVNGALLNGTSPLSVGGGTVIIQGVLNITGLILNSTTISGGSPLLNATGCATVSGSLTISLPSVPTNGTVIPVLESRCLIGDFSNVVVDVPGAPACIEVTASSVATSSGIAVVFSQQDTCVGPSSGTAKPKSSGPSKALLWGIVGGVIGAAVLIIIILSILRYSRIAPVFERIWRADTKKINRYSGKRDGEVYAP